MTHDNPLITDDANTSTSKPSGRRRMGGYQRHVQTEPVGDHKPAAETPPFERAVSADTTPPSPDLKKTRMGQAKSESVPGSVSASPAQETVPSGPRRTAGKSESSGRTRMGGAASSSVPSAGGRQRMGVGKASPAIPSDAASQSAAGTRMGTPQPDTPVSGDSVEETLSESAALDGEGPRWVRPALIIAGVVVLGLIIVLGARWLRTLEPIQEFIATYDGHASQPAAAPVGFPAWIGWQHFFNMFFIVLIIRTGLQVRYERKPPAYWTAKKNSFFSPQGAMPKKVSLSQWLHQSLDVLWVANGLIFVVLLFVTDHWMRIVPHSWDIFPNMLSGAIQYASLDWPTEHGWVHYNALQVMAYFVTVFIAAPLAVFSGIRISTWWPDQNERLNKIYPVEIARSIHFPVMLYFVLFTITHVFLVFFTGALRNLNHMYTSRDIVDWWGPVIFLTSLMFITAAWFLTKPLFTRPVAAKMGKISK